MITDTFREFFDTPVETAQDVHKQLETPAESYRLTGEWKRLSPFIAWVAAATRYQLLKRGVISNTKINATEEEIPARRTGSQSRVSRRYHAMVNFWLIHTFLYFWARFSGPWTGWTSGSGAMVMIAVVTSLAMRLPNRRMVAIDFIYGTLAAAVRAARLFGDYPEHPDSMLLLCISLAVPGIFPRYRSRERRLGSMGVLARTINIIVLDNPMTFHFQSVSRQRIRANRRLCARVHRYFACAG
ncbi:FUSC family protein [Escherichia coli]